MYLSFFFLLFFLFFFLKSPILSRAQNGTLKIVESVNAPTNVDPRKGLGKRSEIAISEDEMFLRVIEYKSAAKHGTRIIPVPPAEDEIFRLYWEKLRPVCLKRSGKRNDPEIAKYFFVTPGGKKRRKNQEFRGEKELILLCINLPRVFDLFQAKLNSWALCTAIFGNDQPRCAKAT
jgi:hypothetical protein